MTRWQAHWTAAAWREYLAAGSPKLQSLPCDARPTPGVRWERQISLPRTPWADRVQLIGWETIPIWD